MNPVYYSLYLERTGPDLQIGQVSGGNTSGSVSGRFGSVSTASSNYYLSIYKSVVDNWKVTGSGTISN